MFLLIWAIVVEFSDNILKPIFLGGGLDVPTLVVLAIGSELFLSYLNPDEDQRAPGNTLAGEE